jgi:Ser/Thr protein kinase RdoA (MazF antagonist)
MLSETPYDDLTPDVVLGAVESQGHVCSGHLLALNSYENRVYQIGIEDARPLVAKFYRPQRWSDEQIQEEHDFAWELKEQEIPVVAPLKDGDGRTLHESGGYRFALFPSQGGRWPDLDKREHLAWIGRFIGRIHAVGSAHPFRSRPALNAQTFGVDSYEYLLGQGLLPSYLARDYRDLVEQLLQQIAAAYERAAPLELVRSHGDCHPGNILWTDDGPHFVDLDDCRMAPAVQDIWMLLSGSRDEMGGQLIAFLDGYYDFHEFMPRELHLVEALRTLRIIHYCAWLARRWKDPAFPKNFPWFGTPHYWEEHLNNLREQQHRIDEPPLPWR